MKFSAVVLLGLFSANAQTQCAVDNAQGARAPNPVQKEAEVNSAHCFMRPTTLNPTPMTGSFGFSVNPENVFADNAEDRTLSHKVTYNFQGLTDGDHQYHVHNIGDVWSPDGEGVSLHFIGTETQRGEVGLLLNSPIQNTDGTASVGEYTDKEMTINYMGNAILGRAMIIHGNGTDVLSKAGQCIIGITSENTGKIINGPRLYQTASATFFPTTGGPAGLEGWATLKVDPLNKLQVRMAVRGLADGDYSVNVNTLGDISLPDGSKTGSTFVGTLPNTERSKAGWVGGENFKLTSKGGIAKGVLTDEFIKLNGQNSVTGRALVILNSSKAIVAQSVIGVTDQMIPNQWDDDLSGTTSHVIGASAHFAENGVHGYIEMEKNRKTDADGRGSRIRVSIFGLTPNTDFSFLINKLATGGAKFDGWYVDRGNGGKLGDFRTIRSNANGVIADVFVDPFVTFNGYNSILGRSISIFQGATLKATAAVARTAESVGMSMEVPPITSAVAELKPVAGSAGPTMTATLTPSGANLQVALAGTAPAAGTYYLGMQTWGDQFSPTGAAFGDSISSCLTYTPGSALSTFTGVGLSGANNMIGRSLILRDAAGKVLSSGVVGVGVEGQFTPPAPPPTAGVTDPPTNYVPPFTPTPPTGSSINSAAAHAVSFSAIFFGFVASVL